MSGDTDEIILEVEDTPLTCKRQQLTENSDYFKAMLEGDFLERRKKAIKLQGVDLKAMNIILKLLVENDYFISKEDILTVLQGACMLQFLNIKEICIQRITELLTPDMCLRTWLVCEQLNIDTLASHARTMALAEFSVVKDMECICDLTLSELCNYLGNAHLQCDKELDVFQTAMNWWYENNSDCEGEPKEILLKLMSCLDFNNVSLDELKDMEVSPDIVKQQDIVDILHYISNKKVNGDLSCFSEAVIKSGDHLLNSKSRSWPEYPCIVVEDMKEDEINISVNNKNFVSIALLNRQEHDFECGTLDKLTSMEQTKSSKLDGYKLVGYKEFIFLFGGEYEIGKGDWNRNFWTYDTIRKKWERKSVMPYRRRHFECCMCNGILYIVGGTGLFRLLQNNMFWYDFKQDIWSKEIVLPINERQIKCCSFRNKLFLLSLTNRKGFIYHDDTSVWEEIEICDQENPISTLQDKYEVFSFKDSIYVKGTRLIELRMTNDNKLVPVINKSLTINDYEDLESVLCGQFLYTIYRQKIHDSVVMAFERFDMLTHQQISFSDNLSNLSVIRVSGEPYMIKDTVKLFKFHHPSLDKDSQLVNDIAL